MDIQIKALFIIGIAIIIAMLTWIYLIPLSLLTDLALRWDDARD